MMLNGAIGEAYNITGGYKSNVHNKRPLSYCFQANIPVYRECINISIEAHSIII